MKSGSNLTYKYKKKRLNKQVLQMTEKKLKKNMKSKSKLKMLKQAKMEDLST